ncbi:MAG: hypothetical protein ABIX11_03505 [Casimicrobiaceae bacterium]
MKPVTTEGVLARDAAAMRAVALTRNELRHRIVALANDASIALTPRSRASLGVLAGLLPAGTEVYVVHPQQARLDDVVETALAVQARGWQARPHIVVRSLVSAPQLRDALATLRGGGVDRILLTGGDRNSPAGPYASSLDLLATDMLAGSGITDVAVVACPDGHRTIGPGLLWSAMAAKQAYAVRTGTRMHVVTQFGFNPAAVGEWTEHARRRGIGLPVHAGLAGPASMPALIHAAMRCGIGNSMHALTMSTSALAQRTPLAIAVEQAFVDLVRAACAPASAIERLHLFCVGGCVEAARWLARVRDGAFDLGDDGAHIAFDAGRRPAS